MASEAQSSSYGQPTTCSPSSFKPSFLLDRVDCFGPFTFKVGRRNEKRWGVMFKCLTTRAVHLELLTSTDSDAFLLVLRRFIARRGKLKKTCFRIEVPTSMELKGSYERHSKLWSQSCKRNSANTNSPSNSTPQIPPILEVFRKGR